MATRRVDAEDLLALALQQAALAVLNEQERTGGDVWFTEDPPKLHGTLKEVRDRFADLFPELRELSFNSEGAFPYSPELRQILGNLQLDGVIGRRNPSFDRFSPNIFPDTKTVVEEELNAFFGDDKKLRVAFQQLAEELRDKLVVGTK